MPANAPIEQYWSVTAYDRETHALIRRRAAPESRVERHHGAKKHRWLNRCLLRPQRSRWQRNPIGCRPIRSEQFELLFRLYGPKKELFEKSWKLPDVE
ncbi:MAG: DUF1214 domain-containing protein [Nitrospira sp.]